MILVTGGAGFIGSNFVLAWLEQEGEGIVNLDKLTYAANRNNLRAVDKDPRHVFVRGDISSTALITRLLEFHRPRAVLHVAAESHVDRSIHNPGEFMTTNVMGTFSLLEAVRAHWRRLPAEEAASFRFLHVSTDEVYGSLDSDAPAFSETTPYAPNSPYSASKAASDHLVRAYGHTYGLPVLTTNCSNNYGPYQFPEKLIPLLIANALAGKPLPIYGDGSNVRDWLHVSDHCSALRRVLAAGRVGETYNIGGNSERSNLDVVHAVCDVLDAAVPKNDGSSYRTQIHFVKDRPGHDRRYAIDARKIERELGWRPEESFASGIDKTVRWYIAHLDWVREVQSGDYLKWMEQNYLDREQLGEPA